MTSHTLELVRELEGWKGFAELHKRGDEYIIVSTVNLSTAGYDSGQRAVIDIVGMLSDYATSGEETMAFLADAKGEVVDWGEIASATGSESRDAVLAELRESP